VVPGGGPGGSLAGPVLVVLVAALVLGGGLVVGLRRPRPSDGAGARARV